MIITHVNGGLGNQMFQYAIARRLAIIHNVPLKIDITEFQKSTLRTYKLDHFCIHAEIATKDEVEQFKQYGVNGLIHQILTFPDFLKPHYKQRLIREQSFQYDPNIQQCQNDAYIEGYWQSEKYFKDIERIIREDFTFSEDPDNQNKQMADKIRNCESVSLHVRRGDYVSNPATTAFHGICSEEYYLEAIHKLEKYVKNPHFFIFSDEPAWAKENLDIGYPITIMDFNGSEKDYEDLRLMSLCQHHIIANSSFSWWGAWLCQNTDKIIIAPKKWFNKSDISTMDLVPESWIRL